ncbi:isoprenylcysteine carboxylmethyltransferase family protein [Streptomyces sp. DSM 41527]|uniref:Isoprenylcysteine carboxylmethyltransferase family protein n=1 Tax=Streptomyces mooreae TaxID=3075523 RepID=A0ABU2T4L5_9ACTN|nr:isoprenylcysteine carboxylmethyltransferase family protein [Streptomyces sp. DSM 41527]MDT0455928.1 isoprenylcysteine carboxylmethyltransferase family protein [Streptomyces sp. DSM 41527]
MGFLHSAVVAVTDVCVVVFLVAWLMGAVYFGAKGRKGLAGWVRGLSRTLPGRVPVMVGAGVFWVLVGCAPPSFWRRLHYWQPELAVLGALLAVASTALLLRARWVLGTMWASVPLVRERHELRTDGPYRLVRHPIYTGLLDLIVGGMLACGFGVWIAYLVVAVPWLLRRVRVEDGLMAGQFGASYAAYGACVPALIPWTRPAPAGSRRASGERR